MAHFEIVGNLFEVVPEIKRFFHQGPPPLGDIANATVENLELSKHVGTDLKTASQQTCLKTASRVSQPFQYKIQALAHIETDSGTAPYPFSPSPQYTLILSF